MVNNMKDVQEIIKLVSDTGIPLIVVGVLIFFAVKYLPTYLEGRTQIAKKTQEQYAEQIGTQNKLTQAVTAALERSNVIIERNTQVIEMNTEAHKESQNMFERCANTLERVNDQANTNGAVIQKLYTETVRIRDKVDTK